MKTLKLWHVLGMIGIAALSMSVIVRTSLETKYYIVTAIGFLVLLGISFVVGTLKSVVVFAISLGVSFLFLSQNEDTSTIKSFEVRLAKSMYPAREGLDPRNFDERDEQIRYDERVRAHVVIYDLWISMAASILVVALIFRISGPTAKKTAKDIHCNLDSGPGTE